VLARNIQNGFAKFLFAVINGEGGREIAEFDVGRAIIRILGQAVANHAFGKSTRLRRGYGGQARMRTEHSPVQ